MFFVVSMTLYRDFLKAILIFLPLLGVTWIFGILAVNDDTVVFAWIFAILNTFQVYSASIFSSPYIILFHRAFSYLYSMWLGMIR